MTSLLGEYEVTLDSKGRFLLPANFRKQLAEGEDLCFVINRGIEKCLSLFPMKFWEPLDQKLNALNDFNPKVREFKRLFLNGANKVEPDGAGRLLVPPRLKEYAGLGREAIMIGMGNKMEIWDKARYNEFFDAAAPEDFSNLANEVGGGLW